MVFFFSQVVYVNIYERASTANVCRRHRLYDQNNAMVLTAYYGALIMKYRVGEKKNKYRAITFVDVLAGDISARIFVMFLPWILRTVCIRLKHLYIRVRTICATILVLTQNICLSNRCTDHVMSTVTAVLCTRAFVCAPDAEITAIVNTYTYTHIHTDSHKLLISSLYIVIRYSKIHIYPYANSSAAHKRIRDDWTSMCIGETVFDVLFYSHFYESYSVYIGF